MQRLLLCLSEQHTPWALGLSCVIATLSAYSAFAMFHFGRHFRLRQALWIGLSGVILGCGVWSTHFIGMLGYEPGWTFGYGLNATVLSMLVAIVTAMLAMQHLARNEGLLETVEVGVLLIIGIAAMHVTGVAGMIAPAVVFLDWRLLSLGVALGLILTTFGVLIYRGSGRVIGLALAPMFVAAAVVCLHYAAMAAIEIAPFDGAPSVDYGLSDTVLAAIIAGTMVLLAVMALGLLITDRLHLANLALRERQDELHRRTELLDLTLESMDQGLMMIDADGIVRLCNARAIQLLELPPEIMRAMPSFEAVKAFQLEQNDFAKSPYTMREWVAYSGMERVAHTYERERPNGITLEIRTVPRADGSAVRTYTDVTDRRKAEFARQAAESEYRQLVDNAVIGIYRTSPDGRQLRANPALALLNGYDDEAKQIAAVNDIGSEWYVDRGRRETFREIMRAEGRVNDFVSEIYRHKTRERIWISESAWAVHDASGNIIAYEGTVIDATERIKTASILAESEARYRVLANGLPQIVWVARASDMIAIYANDRFFDYYGKIGAERSERTARNHPDDVERVEALWQAACACLTTFVAEVRLRRQDGIYRWHKLVMQPVLDNSALKEWLGTALDIDEIVEAREALRLSEERLTLALDAGSDGLWDWDVATGNIWLSDRWHAMLGYERGAIGSNIRVWFKLIHPDDERRALAALNAHCDGLVPLFECEYRLKRGDGGWHWVLARGKAVHRGADGQPHRIVGTMIDIGLRKEAEQRIAHMAKHDGLTGLLNRSSFREILEARLNDEASGQALSVLYLDLDRFKNVNDKNGHAAGDAVLYEVSARLKMAVRSHDVVARIGGDEFAILLTDFIETERLETLCRRLVVDMREPIVVPEGEARIGVSIGVAIAPQDSNDADELISRADLALYCAKNEGRNTFRFFRQAMVQEAAFRRDLELDLREAISRAGLHVHYQPQVSTSSGTIIGFEALARWSHPTRGAVSPSSFIPIAENGGFIAELGEFVLREACREAASWDRDVSIAVNLSPQQFQCPDLPETILATLAETGLSPSRLELEITESALVEDMSQALAHLRRLKSYGIRIALDDFGTGYSSLATLHGFPFDKIKIDRGFVSRLGKDPQAEVIVNAVIGLGVNLNVSVLAEGVEDQIQWDFLKKVGCAEAQGYLFGRPGPIADCYGPSPLRLSAPRSDTRRRASAA